MTTGNSNYEISGSRVLCSGNTSNAPAVFNRDLGELDLTRYCRDNFPNSNYERRFEPSGVAHYCRQTVAITGFTLHPIDLTQACRQNFKTEKYRKSGVQVICTQSDNRTVESKSASNNKSTQGRNKPGALPSDLPTANKSAKPNANKRTPEPAYPSAQPLPFGMPQPDFPIPPGMQMPPGMMPGDSPFTSRSAGDDNRNLPACHALGGQWRSGTVPMVESYLNDRKNTMAYLLNLCEQAPDPYCKSRSHVQTGVTAYMRSIMIWQCHVYMLNNSDGYTQEEIKTARKESCEIGKILKKLAEETDAHGGRISDIPVRKLLEGSKLDDFCTGPELKLVRKVPDGLEEVEEDILFYGGPFYIEAIFEDAPKESEKTVKILVSGGSTPGAIPNELEIKILRTESENIYRSEEFNIFPDESTDGQESLPEVRP